MSDEEFDRIIGKQLDRIKEKHIKKIKEKRLIDLVEEIISDWWNNSIDNRDLGDLVVRAIKRNDEEWLKRLALFILPKGSPLEKALLDAQRIERNRIKKEIEKMIKEEPYGEPSIYDVLRIL